MGLSIEERKKLVKSVAWKEFELIPEDGSSTSSSCEGENEPYLCGCWVCKTLRERRRVGQSYLIPLVKVK